MFYTLHNKKPTKNCVYVSTHVEVVYHVGVGVHVTMPCASSGQSKMVFSDKVSELEVSFSASQTGQVEVRIPLSLPTNAEVTGIYSHRC